jgi:hypothetical protein
MSRRADKRKPTEPLQTEEYHPRTALGRRLWRIRKRIVDSGERLLDWDDLDREVAERRGERGAD